MRGLLIVYCAIVNTRVGAILQDALVENYPVAALGFPAIEQSWVKAGRDAVARKRTRRSASSCMTIQKPDSFAVFDLTLSHLASNETRIAPRGKLMANVKGLGFVVSQLRERRTNLLNNVKRHHRVKRPRQQPRPHRGSQRSSRRYALDTVQARY